VTAGRARRAGAPRPPVAVLAAADLEKRHRDAEHRPDADQRHRDGVGGHVAPARGEHGQPRDDEDDGRREAARAH
jgi:hypothetical protein